MKSRSYIKSVLILLLACALLPSMAAWSEAKNTITAEELLQTIDRGDEVVIIDVRTTEEFEDGHIPGSISMPLATLDKDTDVPSGSLVVVYCTSGVRSTKAINTLVAYGKTDLVELEGGIRAWVKSKGNVVVGASRAMSGYPTKFQIPMGVCEVEPPLREVGE